MQLPFNESLIIIPTYNEIENIELMIDTIFEQYPEISLLIIDDGSPDGTARVVKAKMTIFNKLHLRKKKLGIGTAYLKGFKFALEKKFNYIFGMDCDFSHDPRDIKYLLRNALEYDLVIGSRYVEGGRIINWPKRRFLLSKYASTYTRFITSIPVHDTTGGFKCFTRRALEAINLENVISYGYIFQLELNYMIWTQGLRVKEIPIVFNERKKGKSKLERKIIIEALFNVFVFKFGRFWDESRGG